MKKLENYIKENRRAFDELEPPARLWERIEKELEKQKPKKEKGIYPWIGAVASLIIVVGLAWMYSVKTSGSAVTVADINPVYARKQVRFVNLIEEKKDSLDNYAKTDPELYRQFSSDLVTLDAEYEKLKRDLQASSNQQFIVRAMVKNREMQLQVLKRQLQVINQINQYKSKNIL